MLSSGEDVVLAYFLFRKAHEKFVATEPDYWYNLYVLVCHHEGVRNAERRDDIKIGSVCSLEEASK